ncbi:MAG: hypothetical protein Q8P67_23770 [archaeon]|nr:hypothetical protein [archaeon]
MSGADDKGQDDILDSFFSYRNGPSSFFKLQFQEEENGESACRQKIEHGVF